MCCSTVAACGSTSYQEAALNASANGDQKEAVSLARKEVERFATADECSEKVNKNCGTLALAYSSLAEYQILGGDRLGGETSFSRARAALARTDPAYRASAAGMVYRDVSEAYWKTGDRKRARAIVEQGRAAGADSWVMSGSAGQQIVKEREEARRLAALDEMGPPAPAAPGAPAPPAAPAAPGASAAPAPPAPLDGPPAPLSASPLR